MFDDHLSNLSQSTANPFILIHVQSRGFEHCLILHLHRWKDLQEEGRQDHTIYIYVLHRHGRLLVGRTECHSSLADKFSRTVPLAKCHECQVPTFKKNGIYGLPLWCSQVQKMSNRNETKVLLVPEFVICVEIETTLVG